VEQLFNVKVLKVNTQSIRGKLRRQSTAAAGRDQNWKKAIVTLKDGDKIQLT
jgi:large subunit ribosomal protein L23